MSFRNFLSHLWGGEGCMLVSSVIPSLPAPPHSYAEFMALSFPAVGLCPAVPSWGAPFSNHCTFKFYPVSKGQCLRT